MSTDEAFDRRFKARLSELHAEERHKEMLHDRTIGDQNALRPSKDFIERCVGPMRSDDELRKLARESVEVQQRQERLEAERKAEVEKSLRAQKRQIERRKNLRKDGGRER
jgi:hypothetical protein